MTTQSKQKSVEISWLKEHPRQREFFAETPVPELEELATDLHERGQQEPIHCCADGTLIRGHRRVRAAKSLGWKTVQAVVRHDLGAADSDRVVHELIVDNLIRRQNDDLTLARCYRELKRSRTKARSGELGDARDLLAARLNSGRSGRTLDRLERLLDLPRDVQDMISSPGPLRKCHGEKILRLPKRERESLVESLRAGQPIPEVLRRHKIIKPVTSKTPSQLGEELVKFFHVYGRRLSHHVEDLDRLQVRGGEVLDVLDCAVDFLTEWRDRKRDLHQRSVDAVRTGCVAFRGRTD